MHDHSHGHAHAHVPTGADPRRALTLALVLNGGFLVIEAGLGFYTGSLALLSDAAHMVSDVSALVLALGAAQLARRVATPDRSYGWLRAETLGAFVNGLALLLACVVIFKEAIERLANGAPDVMAWPVLVAGVVGLAINLGSAWALARTDRNNLNVRAALIHMMADALGSLGAIIAAVLLMFGVAAADAVMGLLIGVIVIWGTWGLLRDTGRVLLQFSPAGVSSEQVSHALLELPGLDQVHELHLWSLDGRKAVLSAHLITSPGLNPAPIRLAANQLLERRFNITHTTLQVELDGECEQVRCPFAHAQPPATERDHAHA